MTAQPTPPSEQTPSDREARREFALIEAARHQALDRRGAEPSLLGEDDLPRASALPQRIGRYRIVRRIRAGGMGTVFEAVQESPRRKVAVKVVHAGSLNPRLLRRFELETQVLARLQHPDIAQIYEAGVFETSSGAYPFFAMEFIAGKSLTEYANSSKLTPRERLALMARTCDAVHHAHIKGVIHRDLKPANILVTCDGAPKVLDFGIARAVDEDVSFLLTRSGEPVGTLPYMSPEQASGFSQGIDTRSDVYSLGVVCYELLAGRHPIPVRGMPFSQALRIIAESDPDPLGTIVPSLRGDVETIVAKAMAKDRERRYQSAVELAADIRRYLAGEPIQARPIGPLARWWRWCRRKPGIAALTGLSCVLLLALVIGSLLTAIQIDAAWRAERRALVQAEQIGEQRRRELYAAQMALAMQAYRRHDTASLLDLLAAQLPEPGQSDLRGFEWHLLWRQTHSEQLVQRAHEHGVLALAVSSDGRLAATGTGNGAILLWNTQHWQRVAEFSAHTGPVLALAFRPGNPLLASGGTDGVVRFWEVPEGRFVRSLPAGELPVQCLAFQHDGSQLAWGGGVINRLTPRMQDHPGKVFVAPLESNAGPEQIAVTPDPVAQLAFLPGQASLIAVTWGGALKGWRLPEREQIASLASAGEGLLSLAASPDGTCVATGAWKPSVDIYDVLSGHMMTSIPAANAAQVCFSPNGSLLATANHDDGIVTLWDVATGEVIDQLRGHLGTVQGMAFLATGEELVTTGSDGTLRLWRLDRNHRGLRIVAHDHEIADVVFTPDGNRLITAGRDGTAAVWDSHCGNLLARYGNGADWIESATVLDQGQTIAFCQRTHVQVVDWVSDSSLILGGFPGIVHAVAASPDGRFLAAGGAAKLAPEGCQLKLFDTRDWHRCWGLRWEDSEVCSLAFSPDSSQLAVGGTLGEVLLLDAVDGTIQQRLVQGGWVRSLRFSPDGHLLAIGSWPKDEPIAGPVAVRVWNVVSGQLQAEFRGHRHAACSLAFSPDGTTLATGGGDGVVQLWDLATGILRATFEMPHPGWVLGLAFSPSGKRLACTSATANDQGELVILQAAEDAPVTVSPGENTATPLGQATSEERPLWNLPHQQLVVLPAEPSSKPHVFTRQPPESHSFIETAESPQGTEHPAVAVRCFRKWDGVDQVAGTALVEYPLRLPDSGAAQLHVVLAFRNPWDEDQSLEKPVSWRVHVRTRDTSADQLGAMVFAWSSHRSIWQPAIVDLSDFAGQAIWLQLVVPPDRGSNRVYWVEPTLVLSRKK